MNYIEGDYIIEGEDDVGDDDVIGAMARQISQRPAGGARIVRAPRQQRIFKRPPLPARPQQPTEAELRSYLGLGFVTWAIGDGTDKTIIVEPQETFRGERFIAEVAMVGVTNSIIPSLKRLEIGTLPQSPSVEFTAPLSMFRPDATNANLDLQIAEAGTKITITLSINAAPVGAAVIASCGMFGQWIR